jgi:DNA-binding HxlR family transcriptional regulator
MPPRAIRKPQRESRTRAPAERRSYRQYCGLAKAMDALGERWTLLIARDLMLGPRRYGDILKGLGGMTTNLLAARLKDMEGLGIIAKEGLPAPARGSGYALTAAGRELEPALLALGKWGWRFMGKPDPEDALNPAWALFALKRRYRGVTRPLVGELEIGGRIFQFRLEAGYPDLREGSPWLPEFHARGDFAAFGALFLQGASAAGLEAAGRLTLAGSSSSWRDFLTAFDLPP